MLRSSSDWLLLLVRLLQISYGASSFYLSDKEKYPLFFRTVPPEEGHNHGRVAVLKYFKWDRIAIVTEREPYYEAVSKHRYSRARFFNYLVYFRDKVKEKIKKELYIGLYV